MLFFMQKKKIFWFRTNMKHLSLWYMTNYRTQNKINICRIDEEFIILSFDLGFYICLIFEQLISSFVKKQEKKLNKRKKNMWDSNKDCFIFYELSHWIYFWIKSPVWRFWSEVTYQEVLMYKCLKYDLRQRLWSIFDWNHIRVFKASLASCILIILTFGL